jgi:hypothetical protein
MKLGFRQKRFCASTRAALAMSRQLYRRMDRMNRYLFIQLRLVKLQQVTNGAGTPQQLKPITVDPFNI